MKIEIEVPDITTAAIAMNNAVAAYGKIVYAIMIGCDVSKEFEPLFDLEPDVLKERYRCLRNMYEQIETIEKGMIDYDTKRVS